MSSRDVHVTAVISSTTSASTMMPSKAPWLMPSPPLGSEERSVSPLDQIHDVYRRHFLLEMAHVEDKAHSLPPAIAIDPHVL